MNKLNWLLSLFIAITLTACLHDHDEDHDHDNDDAALVADACNHMANGPFSDVTDEIHGELAHKTWRVKLTASGDTYSGTFGLHPEEEDGEHEHGAKVSAVASGEKIEVTLFADNAITVTISNGQTTLTAESELLDIDECPKMKFQVTYELEVGTEYQVSISGATSENSALGIC